jgi:hypothetical protein
MLFFKPLLVVGVLFSTTLAAPIISAEIEEVQARDYDLEREYAARSWSSEELMAARDLSESVQELLTRDEDYADFLFARTKKLVEVANKLRNGLKTKPGEAVFWSGNTPRPGGPPLSAGDAAEKFAKDKGKSTLGMKLKQEGIKMPDYKPGDPNRSEQLWRIASKSFARKANGPVNAFLGKEVNKNGIYKKDEKPILMKSKSVTKLTEHTHGKAPQVVK